MAGLKAFLQSGISGCLETGEDHVEQQSVPSERNYDDEHNIKIQ
jgi:hypothetical protein